jgi:DNA/RNA endonuclease G (NUC1)
MDLSISQSSTPKGGGWWTWEVRLDGSDAALDQVDAVDYTLHPTFPEPKRHVTDRVSRFVLHSGGWGEFMIYAEAILRDGTRVPLRHWLRLQEISISGSRTLFLTGGKEDETFTDDLQDRLEQRGFVVLRVADPVTLSQAGTAIAVLSAEKNPWFEGDLQMIQGARVPLLIVARGQVDLPECLAAYRGPLDDKKRLPATINWLLQILDRRQLPFEGGSLPSVASAFWSRHLAVAATDLQRAAQAVLPLTVGGRFHSAAVAVAPSLIVAPIESLPKGLMLSLASEDVPVSQMGPAKDLMVLTIPTKLPAFLPLARSHPTSPLVASLGIDTAQRASLSPGWLIGVPQPYQLLHDTGNTTKGAALLSLETGALLGFDLGQGRALPAALVYDLVPAGTIPAGSAGLESVQESVEDDFLERVKTKPEDYANRKGYDPNFLGATVPLPKTDKQVDLLAYANFSVALATERRLSLYAVVNINGRQLVEKHRAGDPWQLDPRVPEDHQVGGKYYAGTPLDRGHMVRRLDPVWGENADLAELDTFHYPNSCPQHKNLNRKTWNDLEDYLYDNLQRDDMKVTVFTGPVLAGDDAVFHGVQLPKEFWKVVVILRDDGKLSATAYLLSQEDMVEGLEFVFGEFRTYQVTVASIEKKTGLDFGNLRDFDPRVEKKGLEAVGRAPTEIRGPQDLNLDLGVAPTKAAAGPAVLEGAWQDPAAGERRLSAALDTFDWTIVEQLNRDLIAALAHNPSKFDEPFARRVLSRLQRKRRFSSMILVGDAFLQQGVAGHQIRRRYAQALIDQGTFHAAELVLRAIIADTSVPPFEQEEAQGLLGRASKQIYVNANAPDNPRNVARLQSAVDSYWLTYVLNPTDNYWHGINVVACLRRAEGDGIKLQAPADPLKVASDILKNLQDREQQSKTGELQAFELATFVEAHLALGQFPEAFKRAETYAASKDADAFEIASTLRQMEEVWKLRDNQPPGDKILPTLRAALLLRQGGSLQLSAASFQPNLEKVFGADRSVSLKWYEGGLNRAKSIARIETNDKGFGTGWLVNAAKFFPGRTGLLLLTNAHVIGPDTSNRYPSSLRPEDATINFQIQGWKMKAGKVIFHSPVNELDATFLELPNLPKEATPIPLDASVLKPADPPQRLYIIGYPGGRDVEFSLQDNYLLAASERLVHYRTPSEGGSSGSPVFGPTDWNAVALHHAGRKDMPRLDGQGTYEANEGIALFALVALTKATSSGVSAPLAALH